MLLSALLLTVGCKDKRLPEDVLDHDQMVSFLYEAYLVEGYFAVETNYVFDTISPELARAYDDIFTRQNITREQVETSIAYYSSDLSAYNAINRDVMAKLEKVKTTDSAATKSVAIEVVPIM